MLVVAIHMQILQPIEIQPIEMAEVALRSRQVAAASGSDLCSKVAALDWRRPAQCLLTLCIKRRATRPPLQPKRAVCAPTSNRLDRVAGGSRRTGCIVPPGRSHRLVHDRYRGMNERLHCAAGHSTHQQQPAIFNARSRLSGKQCPASAAQRTFTPSHLYHLFLTYRERTGGSLQPVRREPPATRSSLLEVGAHTTRLGCSGGRVARPFMYSVHRH